MNVFDDRFITFDGEPMPGRVPPAVSLRNDNPITTEQAHGAQQAYRAFKDAVNLSPAKHHTDRRELQDGTVVEMVSSNGLDFVDIWPAGGVRTGFEMLPAFKLDDIDGDLNSATWRDMPYDPTVPPVLVEQTFIEHPGNQTWCDLRDGSETRGLVLSWWGLSKDRYGAHWAQPEDMDEVAPSTAAYRYLWCNGVKIGTIGTSGGIMGACITEVDGVKRICVVTAPIRLSDIDSGDRLRRYGNAWAAGFSPVLYGEAATDTTLTFYHADLPSAFFQQFSFSELTFAGVASFDMSELGGRFMHNGATDSWFRFDPVLRSTAGIKFNGAGTEGVLWVAAERSDYPTSDADGFIGPLFFDPRDGTAYTDSDRQLYDGNSASSATWPGKDDIEAHFLSTYGAITNHNTEPAFIADYIGDDFFLAYVGTIIAGGTTYQYIADSAGNVYDAFSGGAILSNVRLTGDLRYGLLAVCSTAFSIPLTTRLYLDGTIIDSIDLSYPGLNLQTVMALGFEGADSSFDGRLFVGRLGGEPLVLADDEDETADLTELKLDETTYPVLCGPIALRTGKLSPQDRYVKGDPP